MLGILRGMAVALVFLAGLLGAPAVALAQQDTVPDTNGKGFDTHLYRPALDSKGFFSVNGANVLGANDFMFGLVIDYANTLMRMRDFGQKSPQLINHSFQGTGLFNFGIANRFELGLSAPLNLMVGDQQVDKQNPPQPTAPPPAEGATQWGPGALDSQTFSNVAAHAKVRITRVDRILGVAISGQAGVPVSDAAKDGGGDPGVWYWPQLILEKRLGEGGWFKIGANGGYRGHTVSDTFMTMRDGKWRDANRATFGLGASIRVLDPVDLVAETYGTYLLSKSTDEKLKLSNEAVIGVKLFVEKNSYLLVGGGTRYTTGFEAANLRGFIGFVFEPSIGDRDNDQIPDDLDKCPDQAEDYDGYQDEDGCPDPDNDGDGILDKDDRCPNEPENKDGWQDSDGCPDAHDGDRDHDGILDSRDKCPDDPEDRDGFQDMDGCPDPDNDHDGIPDKKDLCPNDPETVNGFQDADGCPDKVPEKPDNSKVLIQDNNLVILQKIKFKTNSAEILAESHDIIDAVAETIQRHPEFVLMEIAGHADERSNPIYNLRLTQARVNSVMAALVTRNVPRDRIRSKGYGAYCPEDPGHNEDAWEKNRRVEFKIVKTKDGPTHVELGCPNAVQNRVKPDPVP